MSLFRTSCILALVCACLAPVAHASRSSEPASELNAVASQIATQAVTVRCWLDRDDPDYQGDAWGYVYIFSPVIYLEPRVCAGAKALVSGALVPLWQLALGALVLSHEAYHLKTSLPFERRTSEAQTECRAVKRVHQTMTDLGANNDLAEAALPWAIAEHFKESTYDEYDYPSCAVPVFKDFWG